MQSNKFFDLANTKYIDFHLLNIQFILSNKDLGCPFPTTNMNISFILYHQLFCLQYEYIITTRIISYSI
jgi:hypothetical protein